MSLLPVLLAVLSGGVVGFTLGLIGGGGSIMATPLLLYVVGLPPHAAIGTGAVAVSANAFANLVGHARSGNVRWRPAALFAVVGVAGAALGSTLGKHFDGNRLLFLFALLMVLVGVLMLRRRPAPVGARTLQDPCPPQGEIPRNAIPGNALEDAAGTAPPTPDARPARIVLTGLGTGVLAGFFGIGGGFLIVPGLLFCTGMPTLCAVGSSLLSVSAFGLATAANYAVSGLVDWPVAAEYVAGGILGGLLGMRLCRRLAAHKTALNQVFAAFIFAVAAYMLYRNAAALGAA